MNTNTKCGAALGQGSANYSLEAKTASPVVVKFSWNPARPIVYMLSLDPFVLQQQNWVVSIGIIWLAKVKYYLCACNAKSLSVQFSHSVVSDSLRPHESQHARPPCPSPSPGIHSDSHPSSQWCHPAISSSVVPFSSCPQSLPASESFPMTQLFAWGGQSTGVSALASLLPKKSQGWSPSEWTGWISLQSKGLSRVLVMSNSTWSYEPQPARFLCPWNSLGLGDFQFLHRGFLRVVLVIVATEVLSIGTPISCFNLYAKQ